LGLRRPPGGQHFTTARFALICAHVARVRSPAHVSPMTCHVRTTQKFSLHMRSSAVPWAGGGIAGGEEIESSSA
jgi:hypothetical protein